MKKLLLICLAILFGNCFLNAQTTEDFETEIVAATTFTDNGQGFTITNGPGETTYDIESFGNAGWNGTAPDDQFIDNSGGNPPQNDGSTFTILTTDGADITIKSFYLFVSTRTLTDANPTSITFTGKKNGSTVYTIVKSTGILNGGAFTPNNGFTFIDFSTEGGSDNSSTAVDELIISSTGSADYLALDAFRWDVSPCTQPTVPTVTATVNPVCAGSPTTLNISGTLNDATNWHIYTGFCGVTPVGTTSGSTFAVSPASTTTYYVRGEGGCTTPGTCGAITVNVNPLDDATFSYSSSAYCVTDSDPTPTISGVAGGTFSSTAGLSINAATGVMDVSASTPGTYLVTYTTSGTCANSSSVSVTINGLDNASFSYSASSDCVTAPDPTPTITGLAGGTFSSTGGLSINASSGTMDVSTSTPGTYLVTYTTSGTCANSSSVSVTINGLDNASFSYSASSYCADDSDPTPTITGLAGGTFSSTGGLSINAASGTMDVSTSTPGTYSVTYTTAGTCANSSSVSVTINGLDDASFSYSASSYCTDDSDPIPTITGVAGGTFSSSAGLSINASLGVMDVSASTPGTYLVTYTTSGTCPNSSSVSVTINVCAGSECSNAIVIAPLDPCGDTHTETGSTTGGTPSTEGFCGTSVGTGGANWYTFTGDGGYYTASTVSGLTNFDTKLFVYSGTCGALACVGGNDDFGSLQSQVSFLTSIGTEYYIVAGGFEADEGNYELTLSNVETVAPVADNATLADVNGVCSITSLTAPTATDNCTAVTVTNNVTLPITATSTITWTYTDVAGNSSTQTQEAIVTGAANTGVDVQVACGADYTWIDAVVYTADNNTATHTLTNASGCDSVVTLNLTFGTPNTGTDTQIACGADYTWIDAVVYTTDNNTATHTLTNMSGCDSVVTLNLTFGSPNTGVDTQVACGADYTWIDAVVYTADNNTATHTLTNASGCDSVVTLNLTFGTPNTGTDTQVACGADYTWIDAVVYTADNNTATHTLTNASGCDSVVTLNLTFGTPNTGTDVQIACDTYDWIDGNTYTASNTTATHTLTNMSGCDSVVTLDLTINNSNTGTDTQSTCGADYTWIDGNTYSASNNTATHTLMNMSGCDSVVTLDLTITNLDLNVTTAGDGSLMADQSGATYQWITCVDSSAVAGATDQSFAPTTDGDYAVIVTMNNCSDTSACSATTGLKENDKFEFSLYPNPSNGIFNIQSNAIGGTISVISIDGKVIQSGVKINSSLTEMNLTNVEFGTYFIKVQFNGNESVERVVIR
jgi:hypothetical protein